jgi:hypothetical protein
VKNKNQVGKKDRRPLQNTYAVVAAFKPQFRNRPTPATQPANASFATDATNQPTVATDPRNHGNRTSDKFQIIY